MSGEIEQLSQEQRLQVMNLMEQEELPKDKAIARVCGEPYTPDMETIDASQPPEPEEYASQPSKAEDYECKQEVAIPAQPSRAPTKIEKKMPHLDVRTVIDYINPKATEREAYLFVQLCVSQGLNPFTQEAHLVKYSANDTATMVVGKDTFTKRAENNPMFDGFEAGVVVVDNSTGNTERREGTFVLGDEAIVGGWSKVYRKDCSKPFFNEISFEEYAARKKDGSLNRMWASKPGTMIRKVALVQSLREAFTQDLGGCYDSSEMGVQLI
jgi:phage recombination protein Bet